MFLMILFMLKTTINPKRKENMRTKYFREKKYDKNCSIF